MISRRGQPKPFSLREAEIITDVARQEALQQRLEQATRVAEVALTRGAQRKMQVDLRAQRANKKRALREQMAFWRKRRLEHYL
jgi:N-acetylmuramoyl-L-alanine amidase